MRRWRWHILEGLINKTINAAEAFAGVEIGTFKGATAGYLLERFPNLVLDCIDPWEGKFAKGYANCQALKERYGARLELHRDTSNNVKLYHGIDFVFIDGLHTYEAVLADLKKWEPLAKTFVAGHDYAYIGATKSYYGNGSVKRAVDEYFGGKHQLGDDLTWYFIKEED